jgi:hypothetical protein
MLHVIKTYIFDRMHVAQAGLVAGVGIVAELSL